MLGRRSAAWSILLYSIATLVVAGSNFLATILLLQKLGPSEFAAWALLEPIILLALSVTGFGLQFGLMREIVDDPGAPSALLPFQVASAFAVSIAASIYVLITSETSTALLIAPLLFFEGMLSFYVSYWRTVGSPGSYTSVEGGRAAAITTALALSAVLPTFAVSNIDDYLKIRLWFGVIFFLVALGKTRWRWSPNHYTARRALGYGGPIMLAAASVSVMMTVDRYAGSITLSANGLSSYVAHMKTAQVIATAVAPFYAWLAPVAVSRLHIKSHDESFFGRSFYAFASVSMAVAIGLWIVSPAIWQLAFPGIPYDPETMATLIIGTTVFSFGNPLSLGCLTDGRTHHAIYITIGSGIVSVLMIVLLSIYIGPIGVAIGKAAGLIIYTLFFALHTRHYLNIEYPWIKIFLVMFIAGVFGVKTANLASQLGKPALIVTAFLLSLSFLAVSWIINRINIRVLGQ